MLKWVDEQFVARCREHGAIPVLYCIPHTGDIADDVRARRARMMEIARETGMVVIDMSDAYGTIDKKTIWITPWDSHPDARGHAMLAEAFYNGLKTQLHVGAPAVDTGAAPAPSATPPAGATH